MRYKKIVFIFLNILFLPVTVLASEHSGGGNETAQLIGKLLNSTILWGGLTYLLIKPITTFFKEKAKKEKEIYLIAEKEMKEKEEEIKSIDKRLDGIDSELAAIKKRFKEEAERDSEALKNKMEEDLNKLKRFTEQEIEYIYSEALKELKTFALDISIKLAKERLKKKINKRTQKQLIENFIEELGEMK